MREKEVFAKGFCFTKVFMIFVFGCIIGTYYEQILHLIKHGDWVSRHGVIYGPFNPLYGAGAATLVVLIGKNVQARKWYLTLLYCSLLGGISEYLISFFSEKWFHVTSWNYSNHFLNIDGRTTIPFMLFWGIGGFLFLKFLYPKLSHLIEKLPVKFMKYAFPVLVVFLCLNMLISYTALFRQKNRKKGMEPYTFIGRVYDKIYPDSYLKKVYPNMKYYK